MTDTIHGLWWKHSDDIDVPCGGGVYNRHDGLNYFDIYRTRFSSVPDLITCGACRDALAKRRAEEDAERQQQIDELKAQIAKLEADDAL